MALDNTHNVISDDVTLRETGDYKEWMKSEYRQLKDRYDRLHRMLVRYKAGTLHFNPSCSMELLSEQKRAMGEYLHCLDSEQR